MADISKINEYDIKDAKAREMISKLVSDSSYMKTSRHSNVIVSVNKFSEDSTFEDYTYKADILIDGVTADDYANVVFSLSDVQSKSYAPICTTSENMVTIYAVEVPSSDITIPLIEVIKVW